MALHSTLTRMRDGVRNKILILDVERLPGLTRQYWWDRADLKNRYIHYETVERSPRTTIVCAKWYDKPDVIELCEWDKGGRKKFLRKVHTLMAQADIIVGHNVDNADIPWLHGDLYIEAGLPPLPPIKTVDTLKVLRRQFKTGAPFKSLDAFCQIVGIDAKTDRYDRAAMERAVAGSAEDRDRLVAYCCGEFVNSYILARLKVLTQGRHLWARTIGSTVFGEAVDSSLFYPLAFWDAGIIPNEQIPLIMLMQFLVKTLVEVLFTPFTYWAVATLKRVEGEDWYDRDTDFNPFRFSSGGR
jgi:hypothetical protein